jgi:hypothetical protein
MKRRIPDWWSRLVEEQLREGNCLQRYLKCKFPYLSIGILDELEEIRGSHEAREVSEDDKESERELVMKKTSRYMHANL